MTQVTVKSATYGGKTFTNETFTLVKPYNPAKGYLEVWGNEVLLGKQPKRNCRLRVASANDVTYDGPLPEQMGAPVEHVPDGVALYRASETDEMAIARIKKTFDILEKFAEASAEGTIKGLIVVGEPGIGKSFGVDDVLSRYESVRKLSGEIDPVTATIKGSISAPGLYRKLYEFSQPKNVLVLDDCEIDDLDTINMLKAALDTCGKRVISWYKEAHWLEKDDIPKQFEFKGSVICLTNADMAGRKGNKGTHLGAVVSRCHYLDLEIETVRDKTLRIKQVIGDGMLKSYKFDKKTENELVDFLIDNATLFREISLRTAIKMADLRKAFPSYWQEMAETSLMLPSAKFARLVAKHNSK